ncbi:MAG TPA: translational GTPase TypA [Candidatus Saccharimonadales bacterium]|nr:translational GTPase TypA [Candidatus Saccharimonadales bacterium]
MSKPRICNIAIIAHVDHGKTTLVDQLLKQSGTIADAKDRVMDSGSIEKERGITILAKNTGILYKDHKINIVDTPGHADFGGEVERTLQMVEGFLLLVDAAEGVLPGTRFVLQKALSLGLRPIVVINKIDRKDAQIETTEQQIYDLFLDLATDESQLEFPTLYGSSRMGFMTTDLNVKSETLIPLLDTIIETVPSPVSKIDSLQLLITNLDHSDFLGALAVGRIFSGSLKVGDQVIMCKDDKVGQPTRVTKMWQFLGVEKIEVQESSYGDIVCVAGFTTQPELGATLCNVGKPAPHSYVKVDEPTLSMYFSVNDSPFNGKEGKLLTSRHIRERLDRELRKNVALRVENTDSPEVFKVSGRGQLHLGILIETMRREGFELQVSAPEVIYKMVDGVKQEPFEHVTIDVEEQYRGSVMENLGQRKAELVNMKPLHDGRIRMEFEMPSQGLLGFRSQFLIDTRGTGIINISFIGYRLCKGEIQKRLKGALVSMESGQVTAYALDGLQDRGILFVQPGDKVYQGQIIGEHSRETDLDVNPCKGKKLTNMRASGTDDAVKLPPVKIMTLEQCMEWIRPDELIEVTPESVRLRKKDLKRR